MKYRAHEAHGEGMEHGERAGHPGNETLLREDNPTVGLPVVSPANMIPVQVMHREIVAPGVVTVYIVLPGAQQAPAPYLPGQFVTLALPTPRETLYRSYSLCGDGDADQPWSLTIKRLLASRRFPSRQDRHDAGIQFRKPVWHPSQLSQLSHRQCRHDPVVVRT